LARLNSHGLSLIRLLMFAGVTLALIPIQMAALKLNRSFASNFPAVYHRLVLRILGFRVTQYGAPQAGSGTLFVVNHISYLDVEVLGSVICGSFIAKSDVKSWPLFGLLARLQRSVFVDRRVRSTAGQRDSLTQRLAEGDSLILFPEGTSHDGTRMLPFKSSLFSAAELRLDGRPVTVQPVTIAYVRMNGMPMGRDERPYIAWYGDMALAGHLWTLAGLGVTEAVVQFHPPVTIDQFGSRKALAAHCEQVIGQGLAAANSGRLAAAS